MALFLVLETNEMKRKKEIKARYAEPLNESDRGEIRQDRVRENLQ